MIKKNKSEPKVSLALPADAWSESLPKNYSLSFTNTNPSNEYVFTEVNDQAFEVSGKIQYEASMGPVIDDDYRAIMRNRTVEATTKTRMTQVMDTKESKTAGFRPVEKSSLSFLSVIPVRLKI